MDGKRDYKRKSIGATNKRKGSDAERYYADLFKKLGYSYCITSRLGGRIYDNAGIDLMNIPFNVQIKGGRHKNLSPGKVLFEMYNQINTLFPETSEVRKYPIVLFHRLSVYSNNTDTDIVYYTFEQHKRFQEKYNIPEFRYDTLKDRKIMVNSEFGKVVSVSFNSFKENIILNQLKLIENDI